ncbi:MAG: DnaJ domain-containing protein [Polyangiaceae bacterium]
MSDPSAEAERVSQALRAGGYTVVDVPLSMLLARVAVQRPRIMLVDADSDGALDVVAKIRDLVFTESIDIVYMGRLGVAFQAPEEAIEHEGSGFFARPIDAEAVVRKVDKLMAERPSAVPSISDQASIDAAWKIPKPDAPGVEAPASAEAKAAEEGSSSEAPKPKSEPAPALAGSVPPLARVGNDDSALSFDAPPPSSIRVPVSQRIETSSPKSAPPAPVSVSSRPPPSLPSPGIRELPSSPPPSLPSMARLSRSPSQPPSPMSLPPLLRQRKGAQGPLSEELMQLLAEAEERLGGEDVLRDAPSISPEEEIDAVLPEEILAALDDPLEEEDEEEANDSALGSQGRVITTSGGSKQTTGASRRHTTGVAPEPSTGSAIAQGTELAPIASSVAHFGVSSPNGPFGVRLPLSPTVAPQNTMANAHMTFSSAALAAPGLGSLAALSQAGTQGDAPASRGFRSPSEMPGFGNPPPSADMTSPRLPEPTRSSSRPPSTAMMPPLSHLAAPPSSAGYTLGSDVLMPVALALEAAKDARFAQEARRAPTPPSELPRPADIPSVLGSGDAVRAIARSIATRTTGTLCLESKEGVRRVVLREGDLVTAASGVDDESLIAFLVAHGDLPRESLSTLAGRFATFGRHAGAALVAQGYLRQDQLWPVLRAHAEWILGRALTIDAGSAVVEPDAPGRLRGEPSVFGGSTGSEVFVDVVRRVIAQDEALARLGGASARIGEGPNDALLTECALAAPEIAVLEQLRGLTLGQAMASAPDTDMLAVLYALHLLGVIEVMRSVGGASTRDPGSLPRGGLDTIDEDAIRARVKARLDLVEEGDYFAVLGVSRVATAYEIRRAFTELRRAFDPDRILTPGNADLAPQVHKIVSVLEEAYEILRDNARRERYRRAIDTVS